MEWIEIGTLLFIYIVAMIWSKITSEINPIIWLVGIIAEIVYMIIGIAHYSWLESFVTFGVSIILVLVLYAVKINGIGGGILKGLIMSTLYFGRYWAVLLIIMYLLFLVMYVCKKASKKTPKTTIPGELTVPTMPFLIIAACLTIGIQFLLGY